MYIVGLEVFFLRYNFTLISATDDEVRGIMPRIRRDSTPPLGKVAGEAGNCNESLALLYIVLAA